MTSTLQLLTKIQIATLAARDRSGDHSISSSVCSGLFNLERVHRRGSRLATVEVLESGLSAQELLYRLESISPGNSA